MLYTVSSMICQASPSTAAEEVMRKRREREKAKERWLWARWRRRHGEAERIRRVMGCQLSVHVDFLLGAELPRLAERPPSVSLSAGLCFRNSLCSSLESLYFLPPGEHQASNGHTNEATFLLCVMVLTRIRGRRKTKMKLITLASSLPPLSSLFPPL